MKLVSKLFSIPALFALILGVVACGEKASDPAPVLEAPEAAQETTLDDMMSDAEESAEEMAEEAEDMADDLADEIEEMADDAEESMEEAAEDSKAALDELMKQ